MKAKYADDLPHVRRLIYLIDAKSGKNTAVNHHFLHSFACRLRRASRLSWAGNFVSLLKVVSTRRDETDRLGNGTWTREVRVLPYGAWRTAHTYVSFPDVAREDLVRLVEVEDLDERERELDLDGVRRVEERSGDVSRPPVATEEVRGENTLVR